MHLFEDTSTKTARSWLRGAVACVVIVASTASAGCRAPKQREEPHAPKQGSKSSAGGAAAFTSAAVPSTSAGGSGTTLVHEAALAEASCKARSPCSVRQVHDAGAHPDGGRQLVVELLLARADHPHADGSAALDGDCARRTWEHVVVSSGQPRWNRTLAEGCNDGYGARGAGQDSVEVSLNRLTHSRLSGSNWSGVHSVTVQLEPYALTRAESHLFFVLGMNQVSSVVYPLDFSASGAWYLPSCPVQEPPSTDGEDVYRWRSIPTVALPAQHTASGWRNTSLGRCSAEIDGSEGRGFRLNGGSSPPSASLRLLATTGLLFIEVLDDTVVNAGTEADRLELWLGGARPSYMEPCVEPRNLPPLRGYRLDPRSGAATPLTARSPALRATSSTVGGRALLRIELPSFAQTLSAVYIDSDDGKSVASTFATSNFRRGDPLSLGEIARIEGATCIPGAGVLELDVQPVTPKPLE